MKNIILIIFLFLIYSCGYTSIYKNLGNQNFQINITEMQGDTKMNNLIKKEINLHSNKDSLYIFDVLVKTDYIKKVLVKDNSGTITDYEIYTNSTFTINFEEKIKVITFSETINIKNQTDNFAQDMYEKSIRRNFASSIREKLISEITNIK
tara:strand:+ start:2384 stop:2836 length:453 start_codon:yes stop_codon:yes gene_type:complete